VGHAYLVLKEAFHKGWGRYLLLVEYKDLVADTQTQMDRIYEFIGVEPHSHNTDNVRAKYSEADTVYGLRDMHTLRPSISQIQRDRNAYLSREQLDQCRDLEFWRSGK
jgi:hypothetical protein